MDTSKDGIKNWLGRYPDRDRVWLADKCGVERKTVDNWLSSPREIPSKAILVIEGLMAADAQTERPENVEEIVRMPIMVSPEQFDEYTKAFKLSSAETFREWLIVSLDAVAAAYMNENAEVLGHMIQHDFRHPEESAEESADMEAGESLHP